MKKSLSFLSLLLSIAILHAEDKPDIRKLQQISEAWVNLVDKKDYSKAWDEAAYVFRIYADKPDWGRSVGQARSDLGGVLSRKLRNSVFRGTNFVGSLDGQCLNIEYYTHFEKKPSAVEYINVIHEKDGFWRVSAYSIAADTPDYLTFYWHPGIWKNNDSQTIEPIIFHDTDKNFYVYVESDGRHITAFTSAGKILWHRNPFIDSHLHPYRCTKPIIEYIGRDKRGLGIRFNSSQFGSLDEKTGDFDFEGQD